MIRKRYVALIALLAIAPSVVFAWGNDGHRVAGIIATSLLNESTRQQLRELLGNDDLASAATQLDDRRDEWEQRHPGASRWHYENRAVCGGASSCPQGQCVTRQIENFQRVLQDPRVSRERKLEAVVVLVHLIGDLHQPLHLADNHDRGGNDVWVLMPREREARRLHEVWDTRLVRLNMQRQSPSAYAQTLLRNYEGRIPSWKSGTTESWAAETYALGRQYAYSALPSFACAMRDHATTKDLELSPDYVEASRKIVAEQLVKAGVRIAFVLNTALGNSPRSPR